MKYKLGNFVEVELTTWSKKQKRIGQIIEVHDKNRCFRYSINISVDPFYKNYPHVPIYESEIIRRVTEDEVALFILSKI